MVSKFTFETILKYNNQIDYPLSEVSDFGVFQTNIIQIKFHFPLERTQLSKQKKLRNHFRSFLNAGLNPVVNNSYQILTLFSGSIYIPSVFLMSNAL